MWSTGWWWTLTHSIAKPHAITCSNFREKREEKIPTLTGEEKGGDTQKYVLSVHPYEGTNKRELNCRVYESWGMAIEDLPENESWLIPHYSCLGLKGRWESWGGEINVTTLNPSLRSVIHQPQKTEISWFFSFLFFPFSFSECMRSCCMYVHTYYFHSATISPSPTFLPRPIPSDMTPGTQKEREREAEPYPWYRYVCTYVQVQELIAERALSSYPWIVGSDE